ncbi:MAG: YdbH domain-containing protein [Desulfobacterales bacterium]|nr:MAG: YdbH domain-containing protein [Desulfobacterales bacterium]
MSLKLKFAFTVGLLFILIAVVVAYLLLHSFFLPHVLESKITSTVKAQTGIADFAVAVREFDLDGADFSALRFGAESNPALIIESIRIDYSPVELFRKKIRRVIASGVELYGELQNGRFGMRGLEVKALLESLQAQRPPGQTAIATSPPLAVDRIEIKDAIVICEINGTSYQVPLEVDIVPPKASSDVLNYNARIYLRGQKISSSGNIDLHQDHILLNLTAAALNLDRWADFAALIEGLHITGKTDIQATADLQLKPFRVASLAARWELHDAQITYGPLQLQTSQTSASERQSGHLEIETRDGEEWKISGADFTAVSPIPLRIADVRGRLKLSAKKTESFGEITAALEIPPGSATSPRAPGIWVSPTLEGKLTTRYAPGEGWQLKLTPNDHPNAAHQVFRLGWGPFVMASQFPLIDISGQGPMHAMVATYAVTLPDVKLVSGSATIQTPQVVLQGTAGLSGSGNGSPETNFELRLKPTRVQLPSARITIDDTSLEGSLSQTNTRGFAGEGWVRLAGAGLTVPESNLRISGIRAGIPLKWPLVELKRRGKVTAARLQYKQINLGTISAMIQQTATGFAFEGQQLNQLAPDLSLKLVGTARLFDRDLPSGELRFERLRTHKVLALDLGHFLPQAKGITLSGNFVLEGALAATPFGWDGSLHTHLDQGKIQLPEKQMAVDGLQIALSVPALSELRSAPQQTVSFARASLGDLLLTQGRIEFQLESPRSALIEKSRFDWCDGKVEIQALRLSPGEEDYNVILYCDRLNLAKVLGQFGAAAAEGKGTVSGRIPLRFKNGQLHFDDGFLFSAPGEGGTIRLAGTEILTAGIPPNTPQHVQMQLASEALKDYSYSWARVNITTEGEDLLLRLQLDGKPANPLPFVYKKEIGGFAKVEAGGKGSIFQGIRLDVNFRLPLDKMLQYKDLIPMIRKGKE